MTTDGATSCAEEATDLSLVMGGPLYEAYLRCRLARPPIELVTRRIIALVLLNRTATRRFSGSPTRKA